MPQTVSAVIFEVIGLAATAPASPLHRSQASVLRAYRLCEDFYAEVTWHLRFPELTWGYLRAENFAPSEMAQDLEYVARQRENHKTLCSL